MSERGERIGQWIAFALFAILLIAGSCAQKTAAQVVQAAPQPQQLQVQPCAPAQALSQGSLTAQQGWWPGIAPILGGIGGAFVAGIFACVIAQFYTKRLKQIESTLEFSKRFHELIQQQRVLNRKFEEDRLPNKNTPRTETAIESTAAVQPTTPIEKEDAAAWWWCLFDLLLYEYDFYQKGMVRKARFEEWMVWRWHDYNPAPAKEWKTCGVTYRQSWDDWKNHPAHGSRLIALLDEIHRIPDPGGAAEDRKKDIAKKVCDKVRPHGPRLWKPTDLWSGR